MPSGGGLHHRMVRGIEPSRGVGIVLYGVIAVVLAGLVLFDRSPDWRPSALPSIDVPDWVLGWVTFLAVLGFLGAVHNARRWSTQLQIVRMSRDPALRSVLPDVETEPPGPFAPRQRPPEVRFERTPRLFARLPRRRRVTSAANVLGQPPLRIVYLRVFDNPPRSRTFARGAWREFGYVHLLRSAASVAPGELARFRRSNRLNELFVSSEDELLRLLDEAPTAPQRSGFRWLPTIAGSSVLTFDGYGAYPVRSPLCHGDFWQAAVDLLLARADVVVLDLSGYHQRFRGTQFELQRIVDTVPVERVVLLADPASSRSFLAEQVRLAWDRMAAGSPNAGARPRLVQGYRTDWYLDEVDDKGFTTRRTLRASRTQSRWLLARTQERLAGAPATAATSAARPGGTGPDRTGPAPPPPPPPPPHRRGLIAAAVVAAAVALAAALVVLVPGLLGSAVGGGRIEATVVPGSGYKVRSGPSTRFPTVSEGLPAGQVVVVECMDGEWARLAEPVAGGYVHGNGLDGLGEPPDC